MAVRPLRLSVFTTAIVTLLVTGCSSSSLTPLSSAPQLLQEPPVGEKHTAQIGDTLVATSRLVRTPAIHIAVPVDESTKYLHLPAHLKIAAGTFVARYKHNEETCYVPPEPAALDGERIDVLVCVPPTGGARLVQSDDPDDAFPLHKPIQFERMTFVDRTGPAFSQELVYNGRAGSVLKFLYREFISETARPPFTQDVQYDLSEGKTIGFKSARIEVIEATNTSITYRVVAHFAPPPM
jgi:hypothetical protein